MAEGYSEVLSRAVHSIDEGYALLEKLLHAAEHGQVFGAPHTEGQHTVITASVVRAGMGFGFGSGAGTSPTPPANETFAAGEGQEQPAAGAGAGGGGGGGGMAVGRPVAVITIGPEGVEVKPVIDWLKIGLAAATTLGAMFGMIKAMANAQREFER
jgi:uncharacterized spore protein YtfJ